MTQENEIGAKVDAMRAELHSLMDAILPKFDKIDTDLIGVSTTIHDLHEGQVDPKRNAIAYMSEYYINESAVDVEFPMLSDKGSYIIRGMSRAQLQALSDTALSMIEGMDMAAKDRAELLSQRSSN